MDLTGGQAGNVVQSVDLIDGEPVEQSIGDHRLGAGSRLLRRLEDQADGAVEGDVGGQRRGGSEDHRHVSVVPAGVHCSDVLRSVGGPGALFDRQPVHVRPQGDRPRTRAAGQGGDDTAAADPGRDLPAEVGAGAGDEIGGLADVEFGAGDLVEVPAPPGGLGDAFCCHVPRLVELREDIQRELTKRSVAAASDAKTLRVWSGSLTLE